ncbi:MAG: GNAT family N-acetyltransferase [Saprospiraceae bacterium]|nr:GNAT family N-acetyltransferase [Saprospiraceae bacterium]
MTYNFEPFPEITTPRLVLRQVVANDAPEVFFQRSDLRMSKYIGREPAKSIDEAVDFISRIQGMEKNGDAITWALTLHGDNTLIGTVCFWNLEPQNRRAEIGYGLHPDHWGKGLMHEAIGAVVQYGFEVMNLHSITANLTPENLASMAVLERSGFKREAYFKDRWWHLTENRWEDAVAYTLFAG